MKTISIRFSEKFSTDKGTIYEHQQIIDKNGYVWYGKLGSCPSSKVRECILKNDDPKILLIHSGKADRYWLHISDICKVPELDFVPEYYKDKYEVFGCWIKVTKIESAPNNVISKCIVSSSGTPLAEASKHSMSPYFIIEYNE